LYTILKDDDGSLFGFFLNVGVDYLQMLAFNFNDKVSPIWKAQDFLDVIFSFFKFFSFEEYFGDAFTYTNYLVAFYLIVAAIILMIIDIIYVSYSFQKKRVS